MDLVRLVAAAAASLVALAASSFVLAAGLPFWVVSALSTTAAKALRLRNPPTVPWEELIEFAPEIGWKNRGNLSAHVRTSRSFFVATDSEGFRGRGSLEEADIVVFGDSFAFGQGVDDRRHFANVASSIRIKTVGANAYNMVHSVLWMERLKSRLHDKLVVLLPFYGNDLADNLCPHFRRWRTPFVRQTRQGKGCEIVTEHVREDPWPFDDDWYDRPIDICLPGFRSDRIYAACEFLVNRAADLCDSAGATLAVVGVPEVKLLDLLEVERLKHKSSDPELFDPQYPDLRFSEICGRASVPFFPLSHELSLSDHFADDCHWNPRGHLKVARVLEELYRNQIGSTEQRPRSTKALEELLPIGPSRSASSG